MSTVSATVFSPASTREERLAYLTGLFTPEHTKAFCLPKNDIVCPEFPAPAEYLEALCDLINWPQEPRPSITLSTELHSGPVGCKTLGLEVRGALELSDHINVFGALHVDKEGNIMERMDYFELIYRAIGDLAPLGGARKRFVHLIGPKTNCFFHPRLLAKVLRGDITLEGGPTIPGLPQAEIDFIINPYGSVLVVMMCGLLSNFHLMPAGLTPRSLSCDESIVPPVFCECPLTTGEGSLHTVKAAALAVYPQHFLLPSHMIPPAKIAELRKQVGPAADCVKDSDVPALVKLALDAIARSTDSSKAKSVGRALPIRDCYFKAATGTRQPVSENDLGKLGIQPVLQTAACMTRFVGSADDSDLVRRLELAAKYPHMKNVEGAIHGGVKSVDGAMHCFGGKSPDMDWGSVAGCPRNTPDCSGLYSSVIPAGHLARGVSLVLGAMVGDKEVMDFLCLEEPLTLANAKRTSGLVFNKIWRRIAAFTEELDAADGKAKAA